MKNRTATIAETIQAERDARRKRLEMSKRALREAQARERDARPLLRAEDPKPDLRPFLWNDRR